MKILYDVFPAHFTIAAPGTFRDVHEFQAGPNITNTYYVQTTRVIITDTNITVAADSPEGAQIVFNERYTYFEKALAPDLDSYVVTESGKMIAFRKDTNCGCGSRLRSWNPYKTLQSNRDPLA